MNTVAIIKALTLAKEGANMAESLELDVALEALRYSLNRNSEFVDGHKLLSRRLIAKAVSNQQDTMSEHCFIWCMNVLDAIPDPRGRLSEGRSANIHIRTDQARKDRYTAKAGGIGKLSGWVVKVCDRASK